MQTRALVAPVGQRPASVQSQDGPSEIVSSAVKQNATTSPYSQQVCVIKLCKNYKYGVKPLNLVFLDLVF